MRHSLWPVGVLLGTVALLMLAPGACLAAHSTAPTASAPVAGVALEALLVRAARLLLVVAVAVLGAWVLARRSRRDGERSTSQPSAAPDWDAAILDALLRDGRATADLLPVRARERPLAMQHFYTAHPELSLILGGEPLAFVPTRAEFLASFREAWAAWLGGDGDRGPLAARLVEQLCALLGMTPITSRAYNTAQGYLVAAPPVRLSLPARFPILLISEAEAQPAQARDARDLARALGATSFFGLLIAPTRAPHEPISALREALGSEAEGLVLLNEADLMRLMLATDPMDQLTRLILAQVDLPSVSPYVTWGPVPESMFFGREPEIEAILSAIGEHSQIVVGARKMGKSSLLTQLQRRMAQTDGLAPIYLDCQHITTQAEFLDALEAAAQAQLSTRDPEGLHQAVRHWQHQQPTVRAVLLLDEIDQLVQQDRRAEMSLCQVFRALDREQAWRLVLCGERGLYRATLDPASPLAGLGQLVRLGPLQPIAVQRMVEEPMAAMGITLVDAPQLVHEIVALSAGRPDVVQAICQRMVARAHERGDRNLTAGDVVAIRQSGEFREFFFEAVWGNASPLERLITVLMADREAFEAADVVAALESEGYSAPLHAVRDGLDALELFAILQHDGGTYRFAAAALTQVMAEANLVAGLKRGLLDSLSDGLL